jgi:hypothetical protein
MEFENRLAREITKLHESRRFTLRFDFSVSAKIVSIFESAVSPDSLERLKNLVDHENHDFIDLNDLMDDLEEAAAARLYALFVRNAPFASKTFRIKVMSDLDNTAIENSAIAPLPAGAKNGFPVSGFVSFVSALTRDGATSATFVSARPKGIELQSIISARNKFEREGLKNFTFKSGELISTVHYLTARAIRSQDEIWKSCVRFATLKNKCYCDLKDVYPASRFVFLGDDTQGDYIFAIMFVENRPGNVAFIRKIAQVGKGVHPHKGGVWDEGFITRSIASSHPRVFYHESYLDAARAASTNFSLL